MAITFATIGIRQEDKEWIREKALESNPNKKDYEIVKQVIENFKNPPGTEQNFDLACITATPEQKEAFTIECIKEMPREKLYKLLLTDTEVIFCPSEETLKNLKQSLKTVAPEFITNRDKDASEKWSDLVNMALNYLLTHPNEVNQWRQKLNA